MPFSNTYAHNILNCIFGKTNGITAPSSVYLALSSNDPEADGGTFTELVGGNYARVLVSLKGEAYPDYISTANDRFVINVKQIAFNKATADWADIKGFALYDAATNGNMIYYSKVTNGTVSIKTGAVALFDPQTLKIGLATVDLDIE